MCTQNATTTIICSIDGQRLSDSICHERQSYKLDTTHTGCTPSTVTLIPTPSSCMPCSTISSMSKPSENHSDMMTKETVYTTVTVYPSIASPTEQNIMTTSCHEITAALGIVAGMFMLMIAMVTVGCISVWWKMEKKRRLTISSKQTR